MRKGVVNDVGPENIFTRDYIETATQIGYLSTTLRKIVSGELKHPLRTLPMHPAE
jgi:hypothetical protein